MSVAALILNFRSGLAALVPAMERVGVPWKRPHAYDEWDAVASCLYQTLVVEPIRWGLEEADRESFELPPYDLLLDSYSNGSRIEVLHARVSGTVAAFHSLGTIQSPFDAVEVRILSNGGPASADLTILPIEECRFCLRLVSRGREIRIEEISERS